MKNKQTIIILIFITLVVVGAVSVFLILKTAEKCGNEKCDLRESWENCPRDCERPLFCGDKTCSDNENWKNCLKDCQKPDKSKCGDKVCDEKEQVNSKLCPQDCPTISKCGDGICDAKENANSALCPKDCEQIPITPVCGDETCDSGETCSSCSTDCGECPPVTIPVDNRFGMGGAIEVFADEMKEIGIGTGREWIVWSEIEPQNNVYDWTRMDDKVKKGNDAGIDIIGFFAYTPDWAEVNPLSACEVCAIKDMNEFKDFARVVAERYDGNHGHGELKYIEILNEVTSSKFFDLKNTNYSDWLIAGYQGVKEGNPDAKVLVGGFVNPLLVSEFVTNMLQNYHDYYDIVNFHVYEEESDVTEATQLIKEKMDNYNINKPMWITETATGGPSSETDILNTQAKGVIRRYVRAFGEGVERVLWWPFTFGPIPQEDAQYGVAGKTLGLGWVYPKGSGMPIHEFHPRQAYYTYKLMTSKLSGFSSVTKITDTEYKFVVNGKNIYVLWCDLGNCFIPAEITGTVKVTDYLGSMQNKQASTITLTEAPVFIEE